jgi:hypothetical protein
MPSAGQHGSTNVGRAGSGTTPADFSSCGRRLPDQFKDVGLAGLEAAERYRRGSARNETASRLGAIFGVERRALNGYAPRDSGVDEAILGFLRGQTTWGLGWPTGLEPVTFGATIRCSAY